MSGVYAQWFWPAGTNPPIPMTNTTYIPTVNSNNSWFWPNNNRLWPSSNILVNTTISTNDKWYFSGETYFNIINVGGSTGSNGSFVFNGITYTNLSTPFTNIFTGPDTTGSVTSTSSDSNKFLRGDGEWFILDLSPYVSNSVYETGTNTLRTEYTNLITQSELLQSNQIVGVSNYVTSSTNAQRIDIGQTFVSNNVYNAGTNILNEKIDGMSNYVGVVTNDFQGQIDSQSNRIDGVSNYVSVVTNDLDSKINGVSNYVDTATNELNNTLTNLIYQGDIAQSNRIDGVSNWVDSITNKFVLTNEFNQATNDIDSKINGVSNYVGTATNELNNTLTNMIVQGDLAQSNRIDGVSNYVNVVTNDFQGQINNQSNRIDGVSNWVSGITNQYVNTNFTLTINGGIGRFDSNGLSYTITSGGGSGDASQWATNKATTNVNMNTFSITNGSNIVVSGDVSASSVTIAGRAVTNITVVTNSPSANKILAANSPTSLYWSADISMNSVSTSVLNVNGNVATNFVAITNTPTSNAVLMANSPTSMLWSKSLVVDSLTIGGTVATNIATVTNSPSLNAILTAVNSTTLYWSAGASWTPYVIPYSTSLTISVANGNLQALTLNGSVVIALSAVNTARTQSIRLDLQAGTNAITFNAAISNVLSLIIKTNAVTPILFDQPYQQTYWKASGI